MKRQTLLNKLKSLRTRIEDWCEKNGYENMGNYVERKNSDGKIVWKRSDWEHVDALHDTILNDDTVIYTKSTLKQLNEMWKRYEFDVVVLNDTMSAKLNHIRRVRNNKANIYKKRPTKRLSKKILKRFSHMETKSIYHIIVKEFMKFGYYRAQEKLNKLYSEDKISLVQKGKIMDNLSELKMMSSKELKFFKKLEQPKGKLDAK
ncbi:hypothetical protein HOE22_06450 [Candidatus Woesearchaeota archaeon]|nr:hypothetical protein [Candidatus Woesearchaeota archaeon]MBT7558784.1 hypothetical protein [Candidatus Woesearchaeota archaeon]